MSAAACKKHLVVLEDLYGSPDRVMHAPHISMGDVQKERITCKPQWQGQRQRPQDHWVRSPAVSADLPWRRHAAALPECSASSPLLLDIHPPAPPRQRDDIAMRAHAKQWWRCCHHKGSGAEWGDQRCGELPKNLGITLLLSTHVTTEQHAAQDDSLHSAFGIHCRGSAAGVWWCRREAPCG